MKNIFDREEKLIGKKALEKLQCSNVCVFGLGGVGGAVAEGLVRGGIGNITVVDGDCVDETNINRQILALSGNVGQRKAEVCRKRLLEINPECRVTASDMFFLPENSGSIDFSDFDYIADAVDTITAKIEIISMAKSVGVPIISCMGTGNKLDPTAFRIDDISKTSVCPLARVMRRELRARGLEGVKVLWSAEQPADVFSDVPASISFVPPVAGFIIAGEIIRDIITKC